MIPRKSGTMPPGPPTLLIVGAGMTGLMIAASLPDYGHRISLVDKARRVGGRMATRRFGAMSADYGAQLMTLSSSEFRPWVERWTEEGLLFPWEPAVEGASGAPAANEFGPRSFAAHQGMYTLARRLAHDASSRGAAVHTGARISVISRADQGWWAGTADGRVYLGQTLVLTCPIPQALTLLRAGDVNLEPADQSRLQQVTYAPCLCLMLRVAGRPTLPEPGALQRPGADLAWIADNRRKRPQSQLEPPAESVPRAAETVLTLHASSAFSSAHLADEDTLVAGALEAEAAPWLEGCVVLQRQVKRWRYALPNQPLEGRFLCPAGLPTLFLAGDAFGGPHIEGAALSGMAVASAVRELQG